MSTRRQIPKRGSLKSSFTPAANPLKTRGFGKGIQARSAQLPKTNPLQTRPFGSPIPASAQQIMKTSDDDSPGECPECEAHEPVLPNLEPALAVDQYAYTHPIDWNAPVNWDTDDSEPPISPVSISDPWTKNASLKMIFEEHQRQKITDIFEHSEGYTSVNDVKNAIDVATQEGRLSDAKRLEQILFAATQYAVIYTLNPEGSERYRKKENKTYCNIYAYDVVYALGGYIPRLWWKDWRPNIQDRIRNGATQIPAETYKDMARCGQTLDDVYAFLYNEDGFLDTVEEMTANQIFDWMNEWGIQIGWRKLSNSTQAQQEANRGKIVVIVGANENRALSGHISVVVSKRGLNEEEPTNQSINHETDNSTISGLSQTQAGDENHLHLEPEETGSDWWIDSTMTPGEFWVYEGEINSPLARPELLEHLS